MQRMRLATAAGAAALRPLDLCGRALAQRRQHSTASSVAKLDYYTAWFCPFAHRATLALEHHSPYIE